ncbi:MAG: hypothetical protein L0I62_10285 [Gammaproteobacteria bacterium]|nr:hypothetical protein [Gammaproteobacteria bacterium]
MKLPTRLFFPTAALAAAILMFTAPQVFGATAEQSGSAHSDAPLPAGLRAAFYQALAEDAGASYHLDEDGCATLARQDLTACFDASGAHFTGAAALGLHLAAWGRGDSLTTVGAVKPAIEGNTVDYAHGNLTEWWRVLPVGFEQGFTIAKRPSGQGELILALTTTRRPGEGRDPVQKSKPPTGRD